MIRLNKEDSNKEPNISFDSNGPMTSGVTHVLGSPDIILKNAGVYQVNFMGIATLNKNSNSFIMAGEIRPTIALFLNNKRVEGAGTSVIPYKKIVTVQELNIGQTNIVLNDNCPISMQAIITVNAGDILTVKWHGINLVNDSLDIMSNTSITIKQLV